MNNKGITLIALIITIILLLILAVVAIGAVQNDGIINYAKNARDEYGKAQENEIAILNDYLEKLNKNENNQNNAISGTGPWTQNNTTVTNGKITLKVGDYVDYKAGVNSYTDENGWRVLGVENGQVILISAKNVIDSYEIGCEEDFDALNSTCEVYGNGTYASGARCINVDDINRVTGYNPETAGYNAGKLSEYGNVVTYTCQSYEYREDFDYPPETMYKITYSGSNGITGTLTELSDGFSGTLRSTWYEYDVSAEEIESSAYNTIFKNRR